MFAGAARRVVRWCLFNRVLTGRAAIAALVLLLAAAAPAAARETVRYLDARTAQVRHADGQRSVVLSELPLRSSVGSGTLAPVDLDWRARGTAFVLRNPLRRVRAAGTATGGAGLSGDGVLFAPTGAAAPGRLHGDALSYANVQRDTDYVLQSLPAGLEASWVLRSSASPERLVLEYRLADELTLRTPAKGDASAEIVRAGKVIAVTGAVRAFDDAGAPVPVTVTLSGTRLVIAVPHRGMGLRYPITVDPATTYVFGTGMLDAWQWGANGGGWQGAVGQSDLELHSNTATTGWEEWTYTAPGTGYIVSFAGLVDKTSTGGDPGQTSIGIRRANGSWQTGKWYTPSTGPFTEPAVNAAPYHLDQHHCVIAGCAAPTTADSPTGNLSYFDNDQAVVRMALPSAPGSAHSDLHMSGMTVELSDPESPSLNTVNGGATRWVRAGVQETATGTATDPGLGATALEVMRSSTVVSHTNRSCTVATGACTGTWNGTAGYDPANLPEGPVTLGLRAVDATGHTSSTVGSWSVKVDNTAPAVTLSGSATNPQNPGTSLTIDSSDGSTAIERSGIHTIHVSIDGSALPDINVTCPSGVCPRTDSRTIALDPDDFPEGTHTVTVKVEDLAGNAGTQAFDVYTVGGTGVDRTKLGLENYFAYESTDTGYGTAAHVNVANGNLVFHSTPIVNAGRGLSTVVNVTYNSQDQGGYINSLIRSDGTPVMGSSFSDLLGVGYSEAGNGVSIGISGITRLNEPLAGVQDVGTTNPQRIRLTDADGTLHVFTHDNAHSGHYIAPAGVHLALRRDGTSADKTWVATRPDGVRFYFDEDGYQTSVVDRNGNTITYVYELYPKRNGGDCGGTPDPADLCTPHVVHVLDPGGRSLDIEYEDIGMIADFGSNPPAGLDGSVASTQRVKEITDHAGRRFDFFYDDEGDLSSLESAGLRFDAPRVIGLGYSGSGTDRVLEQIVDPMQAATAIGWYPAGGPESARRAGAVENRRNKTTEYVYGSGSTPTFTVTRPGVVHTVYQPDLAGRVTSITDDVKSGQTRTTSLQWDSANNLTRYERATGTGDVSATVLGYDALGNLTSLTDALSHSTTLTYRYGNENGPSPSDAYVSDLQTVTNPNDQGTIHAPTVTFGVDAHGNVTSRQYFGLAAALTHYPQSPAPNYGLPTDTVDELGNVTAYSEYDANGLPQTIVDPRGNANDPHSNGTWRYRYDDAGNLLFVTDPRGSSPAYRAPFTTSFDYNPWNELVSTLTPECSDPSNTVCPTKEFIESQLERDANGNVTSSSYGTTSTFRTFNAMDELTSEGTPPVPHEGEQGNWGETTTYEYDDRDNVSRVTSPKGVETATAGDYATTYTYDALDRKLTETRQSRSPDKDLVTSYAYDLRDNVIGLADPLHNTSGDPVVHAATPAQRRWTFEYDKADNRTLAIEDPGGFGYRTATTYDADDNLASVIPPRAMTPAGPTQDAATYATTYGYDIHDDVVTVTRGGSRTTLYDRRADGLIASITSPRGVATPSDGTDFVTSYTYDPNGDVQQVTLPRAPDQRPATAATIVYGRDPVGDPVDIKDPRDHYFSNDFYDTGDLKETDRPSWWTTDIGGDHELRERTPDEWLLFDGSQPQLPQGEGAGDFGVVGAQQLPGLLPGSGDTKLRYDGAMRLTLISDAASNHTTLDRDALARTNSITQPYKDDDPDTQTPNDPVAITQHYGYDRNGNLVASTDGEGVKTTTSYDQFDRWVERSMPGALESGGDPDASSLPTQFNTETTHASWDENDNQKTELDPRNHTTTFAYDAIDRLANVTDANSNTTSYAYDADGNEVCVRSPRGYSATEACAISDYSTTSTYDTLDEVAGVTQKAAYPGETTQTLTTSYEYDLDGNRTKVTAPGARKTPNGDIVDQIAETRFDGAGRPWILSQGNGDDRTVSVREYDGAGNLRRVINPKGVPDGIDLDDPHDALAEIASEHGDDGTPFPPDDASYQATVFTLNEDNLLTDRWLPTGSHDTADGQQWRQHFQRDVRGRVSWIDAPFRVGTGEDRARVSYLHYDNGWIKESTDVHGVDPDASAVTDHQNTYDYNKQGRQIDWGGLVDRDPDTYRHVRRAYYPNGLVLRRSASGPDLNTRRYTYGYNGNRSMVEMLDGQQHDANDDPRRTATAYDAVEQRLKVNEAWASGKDTRYHYDADGNLDTRWTDGALGADPDGFSGGKKTTFFVDSIGRERRTKIEQTGQATRNTYKTWWPSSQMANVTRQNDKVLQRTYFDTQGRVTRRERTPTGQSTRERIFGYDGNGNRIEEYRFDAQSHREDLNLYTYNSRDQLVRWTRGADARPVSGETLNGTHVDYTLNGAGAVIDTDDVRGSHVIHTHNTVLGYRLTQTDATDSDINPNDPADFHYKYDKVGDVVCSGTTDGGTDPDTCPGGTKYTYDALSRLTNVAATGTGSSAMTYAYDGLDRRDWRCKNGSGSTCSNGEKLDYGYVGLGEELSLARDTEHRTHTYDYDATLSRLGQDSYDTGDDADNTYRSYFTDPNGTVLGLEDDNGEVGSTDRYDLDPYGKQEGGTTTGEASDNPFRFQGFNYDPDAATYDMQARPYRPDFQRYTTPDNFEDALGDFALQSDPLTQERYGFGAGNPINNIEFDGHCASNPGDTSARPCLGPHPTKEQKDKLAKWDRDRARLENKPATKDPGKPDQPQPIQNTGAGTAPKKDSGCPKSHPWDLRTQSCKVVVAAGKETVKQVKKSASDAWDYVSHYPLTPGGQLSSQLGGLCGLGLMLASEQYRTDYLCLTRKFASDPAQFDRSKEVTDEATLLIPAGGEAAMALRARRLAGVAADEELLAEARHLRNVKAADVGRSKATVTGGWDPETGRIVVGCNSNPTGCAEDDVARQLGIPVDKIKFTDAIRPRTGEQVPVCARCQTKYGKNQFPPGTLFNPFG